MVRLPPLLRKTTVVPVRATNRRNTSPTTIPRTPPWGFCSAVMRPLLSTFTTLEGVDASGNSWPILQSNSASTGLSRRGRRCSTVVPDSPPAAPFFETLRFRKNPSESSHTTKNLKFGQSRFGPAQGHVLFPLLFNLLNILCATSCPWCAVLFLVLTCSKVSCMPMILSCLPNSLICRSLWTLLQKGSAMALLVWHTLMDCQRPSRGHSGKSTLRPMCYMVQN